MTMFRSRILAGVAATALMAGTVPAFAADMTTTTDTDTRVESNAEIRTEEPTMLDKAADAGKEAVVETGEAIESTAKAGAEMVEDAAQDGKQALDEMTEPEPDPTADAAVGTQLSARTDALIGAPVYDAKGDEVGEVSAVFSNADGDLEEVTADVGGFLGLGEKRVRLDSSQFTEVEDGLRVSMEADQIKALPTAD